MVLTAPCSFCRDILEKFLSSFKIWVDSDACPKIIKDIIYKAADRAKIKTIFVANQYQIIPKSSHMSFVLVSKGMDVADSYIVDNLQKQDLVITADIPLAYLVVKAGAFALNPRGQFYSETNISSRLATRDLMEELRNSGQIVGGPASLNNKDKFSFANALDKYITQNK